jgi:hypothetical protein
MYLLIHFQFAPIKTPQQIQISLYSVSSFSNFINACEKFKQQNVQRVEISVRFPRHFCIYCPHKTVCVVMKQVACV